MQNNGDKRASTRAKEDEHVASLGARAAFCARTLKVLMGLVALVAIAASVPALSRADFPVAGLVIYSVGMGFLVMPLILYHEGLLKRLGSPPPA